MTESAPKLMVIGFDHSAKAEEFMLAIVRLQRKAQLRLHDAVFIERDDGGRANVRQTQDVTPLRGAIGGALWGLLIGYFLGGPLAAGIAGVVAAAGGALLGRIIDTGIKNRTIKGLLEEVPPGTAALALQLSHLSLPDLQRELARYPGARLVESDLTDSTRAAVQSALGEAGPAS